MRSMFGWMVFFAHLLMIDRQRSPRAHQHPQQLLNPQSLKDPFEDFSVAHALGRAACKTGCDDPSPHAHAGPI